jgi:ribonuclease P protein component
MLPRRLRLRHSLDFQKVRQQGNRWRNGALTVNLLPNSLEHNRFGVVVSRRVGKAVSRNRIKRQLRAVLQYWIPKLRTGYDIIVVAHPVSFTASSHELEKTLERLFKAAGLLSVEEHSKL